MRASLPFRARDLGALEELYERAYWIVAMEDIYDGNLEGAFSTAVAVQRAIGLRHDVDNEIHSSLHMAQWEAERGYRSTYYALHTAPYWQDKTLLRESLETIAECGHEIGIHNDAITVALETGRDPADILTEATEELRSYGHQIRSTVAHGNRLCHIARYVNDEMFSSCSRPDHGSPGRTLEHEGCRLSLLPVPLSSFGLDFDANWIPRGDYLSDSGGRWSQPFEEVAAAWPSRGQLHMLVHPCWWSEAFERVAA